MISVCMATYNGAPWIEQQINSILPQLDANDEVILVDDKSSDETINKILAIGDSRVRVLRNEKNMGINFSFEKALLNAKGDVIFLSDQDDIWYPNKVERVMEVFGKDPNTTLVLSDADIVDKNGNVFPKSYFENRGKFFPGVAANLLKCKFLGCAMSVKAEMKDHFLPFPDVIPGHDMWIGLINEYYGKTHFVSEPLIGYRRHGGNASPEHRQGFVKMIQWRWQLFGNLIVRITRAR